MQSQDDAALDFLESLVIFDRICPFAIEHLPPAMSRRVFDVGLDMGRIRNGLKANREGRRSKSIHSTPGQEALKDGRPSADGQMAVVPRLKQKKSSPNLASQSDGRQIPNDGDKLFTLGAQLDANEQSNDVAHENGSAEGERPTLERQKSENALNFDLKPPPPNSKVKHIDTLCERLFSGDHLHVILKDPSYFLRFTAFLNRYKPKAAPILVNYLEGQKALKAVEYANALAESIKSPLSNQKKVNSFKAASIDPLFDDGLKSCFDSLVNETLPAYVTHALTKVVTESMVREITGQGMPYMRNLVGGLAEVFCLADPSVKDCPIVYASEEFYHTTRYARDDVLGRNCRFLQGPKTSRNAISRLAAATRSGQEICETVLNYRRDGSAFVNLLLIAPLYDNRGIVRYYLGAQIDVSGLVEDGRGMDSFERLLKESSFGNNRDSQAASENGNSQPKHLIALNEFGQMLSVDESNLLRNPSHSPSIPDDISIKPSSRPNTSGRDSVRRPRRVLGEEDENAPTFDGSRSNALQMSSSLSSGGRLPGVYQNYLLVRPYPSLRVIFVSPALRIPGLLQTPFLSRIGGPAHVRQGLADAFEQGAAVTAKVTWLPRGSDDEDPSSSVNGDSRPSSHRGPTPSTNSAGASGAAEGRARYVSCTPLLGSDDQVGVWMVIMVENELVTGGLASRERALARYNAHFPVTGEDGEVITLPNTPPDSIQGDGEAFHEGLTPGRTSGAYGRNGVKKSGKAGNERENLYADYLKTRVDSAYTASKKAEGSASGTEDGQVNGAARVEEVFSPTEEKGPVI